MALGRARDTMTIDEIRDNFALLDDWDDRYRYVIELGRMLQPMPEAAHSAANKVQGCASQVWLAKHVSRNSRNEPVLTYLGDSDAHIADSLRRPRGAGHRFLKPRLQPIPLTIRSAATPGSTCP